MAVDKCGLHFILFAFIHQFTDDNCRSQRLITGKIRGINIKIVKSKIIFLFIQNFYPRDGNVQFDEAFRIALGRFFDVNQRFKR